VLFFNSLRSVQTGSGSHPASYPMGTGSKAGHSHASSAEVKIRGATAPLPQYVFTTWYVVKHKDNFTFTQLG